MKASPKQAVRPLAVLIAGVIAAVVAIVVIVVLQGRNEGTSPTTARPLVDTPTAAAKYAARTICDGAPAQPANHLPLISVIPGGINLAPAVEPKPAFGVQFHGTWSNYSDAQRTAVLDRLAEAGVGWVRIDMGWASFQADGPGSSSQWYVDRVDGLVNGARARGIRVLGTLWMTPGWANGDQGTRVPPTDDASYARMARWAAEHFRGRVSAWEVWNEPNLTDFFVGDAARYTHLLRTAYPAFKAGDPDAAVVLGGPVNNDTTWLADVYRAGAQGSFDIMATHPYQGPSDLPPEAPDNGTIWRLSHVAAVHDLMAANGDAAKPIWFTEFGWSSHDNDASTPTWARGVTQQEQGDYLVRTLAYVSTNFPYVTNLFWYNERDNTGGDAQYDNYGLLSAGLEPKPAFRRAELWCLATARG